ncbi:hypothetical protein V7Y76_00110 [Candidatus Profftella armatura]
MYKKNSRNLSTLRKKNAINKTKENTVIVICIVSLGFGQTIFLTSHNDSFINFIKSIFFSIVYININFSKKLIININIEKKVNFLYNIQKTEVLIIAKKITNKNLILSLKILKIFIK